MASGLSLWQAAQVWNTTLPWTASAAAAGNVATAMNKTPAAAPMKAPVFLLGIIPPRDFFV